MDGSWVCGGEVFRNRCSAVLGLPADIWSLWPEYLRIVYCLMRDGRPMVSNEKRSPVIAWLCNLWSRHVTTVLMIHAIHFSSSWEPPRRWQMPRCWHNSEARLMHCVDQSGRQLRVSSNAGAQNPTSVIFNGKKIISRTAGLDYHAFLCNSTKHLGGRPRPALGGDAAHCND